MKKQQPAQEKAPAVQPAKTAVAAEVGVRRSSGCDPITVNTSCTVLVTSFSVLVTEPERWIDINKLGFFV